MFQPQKLLPLAALALAAPFLLHADEASKIQDRIAKLRSLSATERPTATVELAKEVSALPAGMPKLRLADELAHLVTEGDQGQPAIQAVADTLRQSLAETPVPSKKGEVPMPYTDLANLVRYEGAAEQWSDPEYAKAQQTLIDQEAEIQKLDFTLPDLHGKKVTLSALRGKIVMVNFWATWCGPCRLEMPSLDAIDTHFQSQGLEVLSISAEDPFKVGSFLSGSKYHPEVLLDHNAKVTNQFHIQGIPRTFVFDRNGKLVAEAIDQRTLQQFLAMLSKTDLHP